jgi:hypothetical protein
MKGFKQCKFERMGNEVVLVYLKVLSWHSPERTEKSKENLNVISNVTEIKTWLSPKNKSTMLLNTLEQKNRMFFKFS